MESDNSSNNPSKNTTPTPKRKYDPNYIERIYKNSLIQAKIQEERIKQIKELEDKNLLKNCIFKP
jgi:hypothetical protein